MEKKGHSVAIWGESDTGGCGLCRQGRGGRGGREENVILHLRRTPETFGSVDTFPLGSLLCAPSSLPIASVLSFMSSWLFSGNISLMALI